MGVASPKKSRIRVVFPAPLGPRDQQRALRDLQVQTVQRRHRTVVLGESLAFDGVRPHRPTVTRSVPSGSHNVTGVLSAGEGSANATRIPDVIWSRVLMP